MKYRHNRKRRMIRVGFLVLSIIFIAGVVLFTIKGITKKEVVKSPEQVLKSYMNCICQKNYSEMYEMITNESKETIEKEDFVKRNSAIYEGIEAKNINIKIIDYEEESLTVKYNTAFDTVAGKVDFKNEVAFLEQDDQYKMVWSNSVIYGTVTLTVDAVCEMVLCNEAVITHELTVKFNKDGSFRYLGNKILNGGIKKIPEYQYRILKEKSKR